MRCFATLCVSFLVLSSFARLVPSKDPLNGILDAQLVVIVERSPDLKSGRFKIDEVFLGDAKKGDSLDLGTFEFSTVQEYKPPQIEPITPETRILLFLQRVKDAPSVWEPTYFKESFFLVQRHEEALLLRRAAERALDVRKLWEQAAGLPDPKQRVAGLWPFLSLFTYGVSFFKHTQSELQKACPASGEYFADRFSGMSHNERMLLLPEAGAYGSGKLHEKVKEDLDQQRETYEDLVASFGRLPEEGDWNALPEKIKDATGEIYYGLAGLASFNDRADLPFIRKTALWAVKYHLEQTAGAALNAFRDMPDRSNLPTINRIMAEFLPKRKQGMASIDWDAERALCKHTYPETVPILATFVADEKSMAGEAEACLAEIVGRDLGQDPQAWRDWYANRMRPQHIPSTQEHE